MEQAHGSAPLRYSGQYYDLDIQGWQRPDHPVRPSIPIYLAAVQEGMVRTAGEVADGLIGHPLCSLRWLNGIVLPNLQRGLSRSGRRRERFDLCLTLCCAISDDSAQARQAAAGEVASYATARTFEPLFAAHGFAQEAERIQEAFLRGDHDAMVAAVSDDMIEAFTLTGTPDVVRSKVAAYVEIADSISLTSPYQTVTPDEADSYRQGLFELFGAV
jgi:alkanesulfonate monooxygenase SsuD/methylene tetrahydromethanopterin reductase-like flavin-dependent oxidoreductase (luciferase family)